jgi:hypothetical protein
MRALSPCLLLLLLPAGYADTVVLRNGLELHGAATETDAEVHLAREGRSPLTFDRALVREIRRGESPAEAFEARARAVDGKDAAAWYRLGLEARQKGLDAQAKDAFERVLSVDPEHRAARRELGYEKVGEEWLAADEAWRRKGFVLCAGRWVLPAEADRLLREGLMAQAPVTAEHRKRAEEIARALVDDDPQVRAAAREVVGEVPDAALVRPMQSVLYAPDPATRVLAVKTLGRIRDRSALPALIRTSMYDADADVRAAAYRSIQGFGDTDVFHPYARALWSTSPQARILAAQALAELGDLRGVDVILRRVSIGIGESPRANVYVGRQNSYIQDFDVEIAQAAAIGDPIVQTIRDGIILDYKILGGSGERWIVEERNAYARALQKLTGQDFGEDWKAYGAYAKEQE